MSAVIDPVTLEIMRNRWRAVAEEMCAALVRASYSTNIKDRRDCSAAVALINGEVLAQAEIGTPLHLGIMPGVLRSVLKEFPVNRMQPGAMYITNLPYPEGPGHLPDVSMVSVIYQNSQPVALAATTAHHVDMGGYSPGSMPFGVTEIYQEGLQIPPTPIIRDGRVDEVLLRLINQNVRTQSEVRGDLLAQYAAAKIAEQRVADLFRREDPAELTRYMHAVLDHAERCMRAGIREIPDGVYPFEDYLDDDGVTDEPVKIAVTVTIEDDELTADFSGSSPQVAGPLNARLSAACAAVYFTCKAVIDPELPTSAGAYRPIHVHAPEGSVLQANFPAAIGNANILTDQRVVDVMLGALYQAVPDRVCAACSGEMNLVNLGGFDPRSGHYFNYVETYGGGQGAMNDQDGQDGIHTHLTNTRNAPVEVIERTYPLEVVRYGLVPDTEGAGQFRGGCGMQRVLRCLAPRITITVGADRRKFTPWGLAGGGNAAGSHLLLQSADGAKRELPTKVVAVLNAGDEIAIQTPGGGGWGDPARRSTASVAADVAHGLVSPQRAKEIYGH
ncbi:MAG: hydantoinase B/oxoprolinase family protein [Planctomycetales bacterium]|nr:hydantoinase B/oxoprolinase family protein [Planctomycetales bacterium]NIM08505.1 hydantoinase B/oxoprolinase family protein [Planctomycetales bacterium]NIN07979.1 hydantoinase B/oxoprolinase family protein [Planctomycetales bacterium]NIN77108.1 hydantoinase B/oxoprolinase family protein [Planctomycetales bacterium]NIO34288.1 hydantoinase B/oxoprolinase family protein [Planctomycetales bacterium]